MADPSATTVSVVVATRNGARHLSAQLASIVEQSLPATEVIVADDASEDDTVDVARAVAAAAPVPVRIQRNEHPLGYAENFLRAATQAGGDLIAFADQDDVWLPDKLATAVRAFADPAVVLWVHASTLVDGELRPLPRRRLHTGLKERAARADPLHPLHGSHLVFRRELLDHLPPKDRTVSVYGDQPAEHDEWVTFAAHALGRIAWEPTPLMLYRRHATAVTQVDPLPTPTAILAGVEESRHFYAVEAVRQRAAHLVAAAEAASTPRVRGLLLADAARYRRLLLALERRSATRSASGRARRAIGIATHVLRGDYRSRRVGRLGAWSLLEDLYTLRSSAGAGVHDSGSRVTP